MNSITRRGGALKVVIIIVVILVLLIGLLIGGVVGLIFWGVGQLDKVVQTGIEQGGTYALGVPTTVQQVDLGLRAGTFDMNGFNIANPEGYDTAHFVDLTAGHMAVDYASFKPDPNQSQVIEFPVLKLSAVDLNLEKQNGKANYQVILDNLKKFQDQGSDTPQSSQGGADWDFVFREVIIEDISVHADLLPVGGELTRFNPPTIDEIRLQNVGSAGDPVDMGELVAIVTQAILEAVASGAIDLPADLIGDLGSGLGDLTDLGDMGIGAAMDLGGELVNFAGDITEEAGKALEGAAGEVEDTVKGVTDSLEGATKGVEDAAKEIGNILGGGDDEK